MSAERREAVSQKAKGRSRETNDARRLVGVNGNTLQGRRYRDLVSMLAAELGDPLSSVEELQVRNAASLQLAAEDLAARLARGEPVDPETYARTQNSATRALTALRRVKTAKVAKDTPRTPVLDAWRARQGAEA